MAAIQSRVLDYVGRPAESGLLSITIVIVAALLMAPTIWDLCKRMSGRVPLPGSSESGLLGSKRGGPHYQSPSTPNSKGASDAD